MAIAPTVCVVAGAVACLVSACSAAANIHGGSYMHAAVEVPALPACWADAEGWELSWVSATERGQPVPVSPGTTVDLWLPRLEEAAVLCRARFGPSRSLPFGALWPLDLGIDGTVQVGADGGYAAELAAALYRSGSSACRLDMRRFVAEALARLPDPWDVDPAGLAAIVADRGFSVGYLGQPAMVDVAIDGLERVLSPDGPWSTAAVPDDTGRTSVRVASGRIRRWFGGGYVLAVGVSASGLACWTLGPADSGTAMENVLPEPSTLATEASPP